MSDADAKKPHVIRVSADQPSAEALEPAAERLRRGHLVAFPTETVYGLGANALDASAVAKIFAAKQRPPTNPLIVHVAELDDVERVVAEWPDLARRLAEAFWPGPLTLVLPKNRGVPGTVSAGLDTVGVRMPAHPVARALIRLAGVPVAAPSANRYTEVSPTRAEHVVESLGDAVDVVVDAGPTQVGVESTVLSLVDDTPRILRPGMITGEQIARVAPGVVYASEEPVPEEDTRPSPGLARKHYAPEATVSVVDDVDAMLALVGAAPEAGFVLVDEPSARPAGPVAVLGDNPDAYAEKLYDALRDLDRRGCERIIIARPPTGERWRAIHDRLTRASH